MLKKFQQLLLCLCLVLLVAVQAHAFSDQSNPKVSGKVIETMDVDNYTYLQVDNGNGMRVWAAVAKTPVKVGDEVEIDGGMIMQNFTSKTLDRTFPAIIFAQGLTKK